MKTLKFGTVYGIAKKEIKSWFDHPIAYILLLVVTLLSFFFFFQLNSVSKEASLRGYFELLPWVFMIFVPAITMRSFSEEYRRGTVETLMTSPVSNLEVITAKFVASLLFAISPLILSLLIAITFNSYAKLDFGVLFGQYSGAILLAAAFTSLGLWMSSMTKNQIVALLGTIVISLFFMLINSDLITINLPASVSEVFRQLSLTAHMASISRGVIDFRDLAYFVGFIGVFLSLTVLGLNNWLGFGRNIRLTYILVGTIIGVMLINLLAIQIPWRLDLTKNKSYTLSQATIDIVNNAKGPVKIILYKSEQLPTQISLAARDITDTLNDYQRLGRGKIVIEQVDPGSNELAAKEAQTNGIQPVQFNTMSKGEFKVNQGYFGLIVEKGKDKQAIPYIQDTSDFEYQVSAALAKITKAKQPKVAILQGHEEADIAQEYQAFAEELNKTLQAEPYAIEASTKEIPASYNMILILDPKKELTQQEADLLDAYVKKGGSVFVIQNGVTVDLQTMQANKSSVTFKELYKKWGITFNNDLVYDLQSNSQVTAGNQVSQVILPYPFWIRAITDPNKAITKKIETVMMPWPSSISASFTSGKIMPVLATTNMAGIQTSKFNINPLNNNLDQKSLRQHVLAVLTAVGKGQALIVGSADFLKTQFAQQSQQNIIFALNAVDVLTQSQGLSQIKAKKPTEIQLQLASPQQYDLLRYGNMAVASILILAFGAWRLVRRSQRQHLTYDAGAL